MRGFSSFYRPLVPRCTAPGSARVPALFGPAAVGAPELLGSPAEDGLLPMPVPVVPSPAVPGFNAPPLFVPPAAGAPEDEPPLAAPPDVCASAKVLASASAPASAIVVSFIVLPPWVSTGVQSGKPAEVPRLWPSATHHVPRRSAPKRLRTAIRGLLYARCPPSPADASQNALTAGTSCTTTSISERSPFDRAYLSTPTNGAGISRSIRGQSRTRSAAPPRRLWTRPAPL